MLTCQEKRSQTLISPFIYDPFLKNSILRPLDREERLIM